MRLSSHTEIEAKFDASTLKEEDFNSFVVDAFVDVERFEHVQWCPDNYYESGQHVVRHRQDPSGKHELTVKRRKSAESMANREEIDLHFDHGKTFVGDVDALLTAIGFTKALTVWKNSYIWTVKLVDDVCATFVYYETRCYERGGPRRFVEVEIEKGSLCDEVEARAQLASCVRALQTGLALGEPLNASLWEIYSGKTTASVDPL